MGRPLISPRFPRRLVMLGTPLFLASLGLRYPMGFSGDVFHSLLPETDLWLSLHLARIVLCGLMALAIWHLVDNIAGWLAAVSRAAAAAFALFSAARDGASGLTVGVLLDNARGLPPADQAAVARAVQQLWFSPLAGGGLSLLTILATLGWLMASLGAAAAHYRTGGPLTPVVFLILAAVLYGITPVPPFGPLGMVCFFLAALKLEWRRGRTGAESPPLPEQTPLQPGA